MSEPLKPIRDVLQNLASQPQSTLTSRDSPGRSLAAANAARVLLGCFRTGEANDPEVYTTAVIATLACYPEDIIREVSDPRTGLPSRSKFLPTVSEIREACERLEAREAIKSERAEQEARQLAERHRLDAMQKQPRVDLAAEYPPNWGLSTSKVEESEATKAARIETFMEANRRAFLKECEAAGVSPESIYSPSLMKVIRGEAE